MAHQESIPSLLYGVQRCSVKIGERQLMCLISMDAPQNSTLKPWIVQDSCRLVTLSAWVNWQNRLAVKLTEQAG